MFSDLKWMWLPFLPGHCKKLQTELERVSSAGEKSWLFGDYRASSVVREIVDRIASRAQGLLAILAIPFSLFAYRLGDGGPLSTLSIITLVTLALSLIFLVRCMLITWAPPELLSDQSRAYDHYFRIMMARIRSFYLGFALGMTTIGLLLLRL